MIVAPHFPPQIGGVERYVEALAHGLARDYGDRVVVVTTDRERRIGGAATNASDEVRVVRLPVLATLSNSPIHVSWPGQLRRLFHAERPDVVSTHSPVLGLSELAVFLARPIPVVATYHTGSLSKGRPMLDQALAAIERIAVRPALHRADAVVTTSPAHSRYRALRGLHPRYVPPGVDLNVFFPKPTAPLSGDPTVLYVGRIERSSPWKGLEVLLHAMTKLTTSVDQVRLRLVGGGDGVDALTALADSLGLAGRVDFSGPLPPDEVANAYRCATVTCLPSTTDAEAFGMVLIESMACGTPVVGFPVGGVPLVIGDTLGGVVASPVDPDGLASSLQALIVDPNRRRELGARGAAAVAERYTWARTVASYRKVLEATVRKT